MRARSTSDRGRYELFNRGELDQALSGFSEDIEWLAPEMVPDPGSFSAEGGRRVLSHVARPSRS